MPVDKAGHHRGPTQIDHPGARGNGDPPLRTDVGDAFVLYEDHLFGQHLARLAVEQATGTDGHRGRGDGRWDPVLPGILSNWMSKWPLLGIQYGWQQQCREAHTKHRFPGNHSSSSS